MRIAVIIPTWNEAANISAAIASAWSAGADEVLVVDGGSRDDTVAVARQSATTVLNTSSGRGHQQNAGAAAANATWLLFLHGDSRLGTDCIVQLRSAAQGPAVGCGAFRQRIEAPGRLYRLLEWGNAARVRWWGLPYGDQVIFVRRDLFIESGGFPEIRLMEDYVLMRRLRRRTRPVLLDGPVFVSPRRWQQHGVLRQTLRNWMLIVAYHAGVSTERLARIYYPAASIASVSGERDR